MKISMSFFSSGLKSPAFKEGIAVLCDCVLAVELLDRNLVLPPFCLVEPRRRRVYILLLTKSAKNMPLKLCRRPITGPREHPLF